MGTVHPVQINKTVLKYVRRYPNKRFIIHYLQPHAPYIGRTKIVGTEIKPKRRTAKLKTKVVIGLEKLMRERKIPINILRKAYEDNLKLVLEEARKLIEYLDGKIIVTSDHGECLGEWLIYGHPRAIYIKELMEVPWLIIDKGKRRIVRKSKKEEIKSKLRRLKKYGKIKIRST